MLFQKRHKLVSKRVMKIFQFLAKFSPEVVGFVWIIIPKQGSSFKNPILAIMTNHIEVAIVHCMNKT